jgi:hypothetical protein
MATCSLVLFQLDGEKIRKTQKILINLSEKIATSTKKISESRFWEGVQRMGLVPEGSNLFIRVFKNDLLPH